MTTWVCAKCGTAFGEGEAQRTFAAMLAALKEVVKAIAEDKSVVKSNAYESDDAQWLVDKARAAIALAEGEGT